MCVRCKVYQRGFSSCPRGGDLGLIRDQKLIPSVCLSVMLSPPKPLNQIQPNWCVSYSHAWACNGNIFHPPPPLGPWRGPNFVCLFVCLFDCFFMSHQQSFSYVRTGLLGLNQYYARINLSCSRTQRSKAVRLEPAGLRPRVNHSTTEPLRSLHTKLCVCSQK